MEQVELEKRLENITGEQFSKLLNECFSFFTSFLNSISDEEDEKLQKNMAPFLKSVQEIGFKGNDLSKLPVEEKTKVMQKLIRDYYEAVTGSLKPENQKKFEDELSKIIERVGA